MLFRGSTAPAYLPHQWRDGTCYSEVLLRLPTYHTSGEMARVIQRFYCACTYLPHIVERWRVLFRGSTVPTYIPHQWRDGVCYSEVLLRLPTYHTSGEMARVIQRFYCACTYLPHQWRDGVCYSEVLLRLPTYHTSGEMARVIQRFYCACLPTTPVERWRVLFRGSTAPAYLPHQWRDGTCYSEVLLRLPTYHTSGEMACVIQRFYCTYLPTTPVERWHVLFRGSTAPVPTYHTHSVERDGGERDGGEKPELSILTLSSYFQSIAPVGGTPLFTARNLGLRYVQHCLPNSK